MRQISNENDKQNMVSRQKTLPHPVHIQMKRPHLQRSYSNQQHNRLVHRTASFGPATPHKASQVGRQHSFQVPSRPTGNEDSLKFLPTTPVFVPSNIRGPMTPMAPPAKPMVPITVPNKIMTYSLDRRQIRKLPFQNSHQDFPIYQNLNGNSFCSFK